MCPHTAHVALLTRYSHTSKEFGKVVIKGTSPPPRGFPGGDVIGSKMYVYGGTPEPHPITTISTISDKIVYGDMWVFDFNAKVWTSMGQEGEVAPSLYGHTLTKISPTKLAMFGGVGPEGNLYNHLCVTAPTVITLQLLLLVLLSPPMKMESPAAHATCAHAQTLTDTCN